MPKIDTVYQNILNFQIKTFLKMKKITKSKKSKIIPNIEKYIIYWIIN